MADHTHQSLGQLGIAVMGPLFETAARLMMCMHPPFPAIPIMYVVAGFGTVGDGRGTRESGSVNANSLLR